MENDGTGQPSFFQRFHRFHKKPSSNEFTEFSIKCKKKIYNQFWGTQTPPEFTKSRQEPVESEASAIDASMICLPPETCFCVGICTYLGPFRECLVWEGWNCRAKWFENPTSAASNPGCFCSRSPTSYTVECAGHATKHRDICLWFELKIHFHLDWWAAAL